MYATCYRKVITFQILNSRELITPDRLNNGDITDSAAQSACCLKPKDYRKAYDLIIRAIEEAEKQELTYDELHEMYNTDSLDALMKPYFSQVEKELLSLDKGLDRRMAIFTGAVFFWVCGSAKVSLLLCAVANLLTRYR